MPSDTFFNPGALEHAARALRSAQALIVTDADTEARGVADEVRRHLAGAGPGVRRTSSPSRREAVVRAGVERARDVRPDLIVAVGGGSVIDAAKAMRLLHENPELTLAELALPFLDARKRVAALSRRSAPRPAGRRAHHLRHRLGGLAGRGAHRRRRAS